MSIKSRFAILDVEAGRHKLAKHFETRPRLGPCPKDLRIPITITGYIDDVWGHDDGTSQEFGVIVTQVTTTEQALLHKILHWASSRCPCENEQPNPCPLCGASVENLEACKAIEETIPRHILIEIRRTLNP